jgi:predicted nucleotide-binding protein
MSFRRLIGGRAAMSNADGFDIVLHHHSVPRSQRVFITRSDSGKILEHVKEFVASGRFEPVVARERVTAGGPLLYDLVKQMRGCDTAIIHVTADTAPADPDLRLRISDEVLIEIGAAMALYGREFILLVEDAVELPPNLRGLRECRYGGDELTRPAKMRLLHAFISFTQWPSRRFATSSVVSAFGHMQQADEVAAKH